MALACLLAAPAVRAQVKAPPGKVFRVGFLVLNTQPVEEPVIAHLVASASAEGYPIAIERGRAEGRPDRLAALAADLVERKVDVLVAYTNAAAFAARAATGSIPIVVWAAHDAVGTGLVASLSRPGGNVTGVESLAPELDSKRVQFVRELLPAAKRLAAFYNPADPGAAAHLRAIREAAAVLGFEVLPIEIADRDGVDRALATFASLRPDALLTITDPVTNHAFDRFAEAARLARTPTMCEFREFTQRGCVMAYGATLAEFNQRVLRFIELIRKGARPADLPLEQVTRFELAMNMKAARAIGVVPPASILLRADHVIE